ncbi:MAG: winged helix-turn-helix transcriptional regulator, partial [Clostridia bacterium]|nr:winged helix-turn-helix transcriptional regulator [Clostridia bacterium]
GKALTLTATEFDLLELLTRNAGAALSRDKMLSAVWGWTFVGETRTVDVHIQRLRAKLGNERIETVYKYGYRWTGGTKKP